MRPEPPPSIPRAAPPVGAATILIVDDNAVNAMILRAMLTKNGYDPMTASNGRDGIALSARHRPGLILMDLQMPTLDGFATASAIRAASDGAAPVMVAVTANAGPDVHAACQAAGFAAVLAKPIVLDDLLAMMKRLLG